MMSRDLDRLAQEAVDRHDRLLCHKAMELALGKLVALDGIPEVRRLLLNLARSLKYTDGGTRTGQRPPSRQ